MPQLIVHLSVRSWDHFPVHTPWFASLWEKKNNNFTCCAHFVKFHVHEQESLHYLWNSRALVDPSKVALFPSTKSIEPSRRPCHQQHMVCVSAANNNWYENTQKLGVSFLFLWIKFIFLLFFNWSNWQKRHL